MTPDTCSETVCVRTPGRRGCDMLGVWWSKIMPSRPSHVRVRDVLTTIDVLRAVSACPAVRVKSNCTSVGVK